MLLKQSILQTLAYFDLADYPLTKEELFANLWQPPPVAYFDFLEVLEQMLKDGVVLEKYGYLFLPNRQELVENRRRRLLFCEAKNKIAIKAAKKLRAIPFLKAIFVCNSTAAGTALDKSDIDFFIVTAPRRIWLTRFFTNMILKFWGLRTYENKTRDRVCLSFFIDENNLNLEPLKIAEDDIHFAYWLGQMLPIYDPRKIFTKFLSANNWTKKYLPNQSNSAAAAHIYRVDDSRFGKFIKKAGEITWTGLYGDLLEKQAKALQMQLLKQSIKQKAELKDKGVVLSDTVIKLHENDTRQKYREEWVAVCHSERSEA